MRLGWSVSNGTSTRMRVPSVVKGAGWASARARLGGSMGEGQGWTGVTRIEPGIAESASARRPKFASSGTAHSITGLRGSSAAGTSTICSSPGRRLVTICASAAISPRFSGGAESSGVPRWISRKARTAYQAWGGLPFSPICTSLGWRLPKPSSCTA
ncbi:MAG: hypothetical protein BWX70_02586 [Verrucomicrobia bacterium ADurb.Bin070]|nr:MAG: hypothetical protein BWX70_02586 [Verrucomicrobia bacterium ADurb.Bin070]